ncbi:MAG: DUF2141 domain-containing protein [Bacteroidales bacterium]|nr:DUF2141 domain-containing protein [Bacteroidales bacterium]NLK80973.1 DUF2141 domain-containing protein [Bacteroidales bacterium]HPY82379.1 hypothetical protein [Bacteroidales bacterium]
MKKVLFFAMAAFLMVASSCSKETSITANLTWEDKGYKYSEDKWKACVYDGILTVTRQENPYVTATPIDKQDVKFKAEKVIFTVDQKSYTGYTIMVYNDANGNGKFDDGEYYRGDIGSTDKGETLTLKLPLVY